jgi:hypothetical protein
LLTCSNLPFNKFWSTKATYISGFCIFVLALRSFSEAVEVRGSAQLTKLAPLVKWLLPGLAVFATQKHRSAFRVPTNATHSPFIETKKAPQMRDCFHFVWRWGGTILTVTKLTLRLSDSCSLSAAGHASLVA